MTCIEKYLASVVAEMLPDRAAALRKAFEVQQGRAARWTAFPGRAAALAVVWPCVFGWYDPGIRTMVRLKHTKKESDISLSPALAREISLLAAARKTVG